MIVFTVEMAPEPTSRSASCCRPEATPPTQARRSSPSYPKPHLWSGSGTSCGGCGRTQGGAVSRLADIENQPGDPMNQTSQPAPKRILVTGATGAVGQATCTGARGARAPRRRHNAQPKRQKQGDGGYGPPPAAGASSRSLHRSPRMRTAPTTRIRTSRRWIAPRQPAVSEGPSNMVGVA